MNTKTKNQIIEELNRVINNYVYNSRLFAGGCCYSAYLLAKYLKQMGISYKTVIFQYDDILNETNFNNAINGRGVSHVAIEVTYKFHKVYIGACDGIYCYFKQTGEKFKVRKYSGISPEEILEGYRNNEWNWSYDTHCNGPLSRDIKKVYLKFAEM